MTRDEMDRLTATARSLSEKIRTLYEAGVPAAEIARYLERRYQHVYNVIKDYKRRRGEVEPINAPAALGVVTIAIGPDGTIPLPADWLGEQGLGEGDVVVCRPEAGGLLLLSRAAATAMLREAARIRMPEEAALFDALLGGTKEK